MTDEESYEIHLTNKALVFYFMAGATGLILSFLAGVMVGRGVDAPGGEVQAARPPGEEKVISEETPRPAAAAENLSYAQRLESEKGEDALEKPRPSPRAAATPAAAPSSAAAPPVTVAQAPPATTPPRPATTPKPAASARPTPAASPRAPAAADGSFSIQVGAFKDKATAESVVARLKGRGFAAYAISPAAADGLVNVRVGSFPARADAERIQARLRDEEKFKPFIVKN
ncbi:MAG TPA: SPOR domain-containing protein [Vicinamibacteria bacterium]